MCHTSLCSLWAAPLSLPQTGLPQSLTNPLPTWQPLPHWTHSTSASTTAFSIFMKVQEAHTGEHLPYKTLASMAVTYTLAKVMIPWMPCQHSDMKRGAPDRFLRTTHSHPATDLSSQNRKT